jgi:hydrogenase maturation protease
MSIDKSQKPILILGIGNILLKDEGIGVHVANKFMEMPLPPEVEVMDGGTLGIDLLFYIEGREKVIVVDTVKAGEPPGTMYRFTDKELSFKKDFLRTAHGIDFADVVRTADRLGTKPEEIVFIGIEPQDMNEGMELSPLIAERIPAIIELVRREIQAREKSGTRGD